jgi:hypothetical protein
MARKAPKKRHGRSVKSGKKTSTRIDANNKVLFKLKG